MDYSNSDKDAPQTAETEIILINLLIHADVIAYRAVDGASSCILPKDYILFVYENIIKRRFGQYSEGINSGKLDLKSIASYSQYHYTILLKFLLVFRYYLPPGELLSVTQLVSYFLVSDLASTVSCTLIFIENVFYMRPFKENNQLGVPFSPSSIYEKVYRDPRKIVIDFEAPLGSCIFNSTNIFPFVQHVLENIRKLMIASPTNIDHALICLSRLTYVLGETIGDYSEAFLGIFIDQIKKMMANGFKFSSLNLIFESISIFFTRTAHNKPLHEVINQNLIPVIMGLMSQSDTSITSFVLQSLALWLRISGMLSEGYNIILKSVLDPSNMSPSLIPIMPSFAVYIIEYIKAVPSTLVDLKGDIQRFLSFISEASLDSLFFSFFYRLIDAVSFQKAAEAGWIDFLVKHSAGIFSVLASNRGTAYNSRPLFIKEICMFVVNLSIKTSFNDIVQLFEASSPGLISMLLASPELSVLLTFFSQRIDRPSLVFAFSSILLDNSGFFGSCQDVWKSLLAALLQNVQTNFKGIGSLRELKITTSDWRSYQEMWDESRALKNSPASTSISLMKAHQKIVSPIVYFW